LASGVSGTSRVHELTYYHKVQDISAGGRTRNVKYNHHTALKEIPLFDCKIQLSALLTLYFVVGLEYTKCKILPNLLYAHHVLSNFVTSRFLPRFSLDFGRLTPPITYMLGTLARCGLLHIDWHPRPGFIYRTCKASASIRTPAGMW